MYKPGDWVKRLNNTKGSEIKLVVACRENRIWYCDDLGDNKNPSIYECGDFEVEPIVKCQGFHDTTCGLAISGKDMQRIFNGLTSLPTETIACEIEVGQRCSFRSFESPVGVVEARVTYVDEHTICFEVIHKEMY